MPKLGMETIRRRQVIDAVIHILSEQGWRDLTVREVSEVAGVSSGILSHYFGKKRAMIIDSISEAYRTYRKMVAKVIDTHTHPVQQLVALVDGMTNPEAQGVPGWSFWLAIDGRMPFDQVLRAEANAHEKFLHDSLTKLFENGAALGVFSCKREIGELTGMFLALVHGLGYQTTLNSRALTPQSMKKLILNWLEPELDVSFRPTAIDEKKTEKARRNVAQ